MATILTLLGRRPAPAPRWRLVEVTSHWSRVDGEFRREVRAISPSGQLVTRYLPDSHPALVRFLERAAVAA